MSGGNMDAFTDGAAVALPSPSAPCDAIMVAGFVNEFGIGPTDRLIYSLIYQTTADGRGVYTAGTAYAAARAGVTQRTAQNSVRRLLERGLIHEVGPKRARGDSRTPLRLAADMDRVREACAAWSERMERARRAAAEGAAPEPGMLPGDVWRDVPDPAPEPDPKPKEEGAPAPQADPAPSLDAPAASALRGMVRRTRNRRHSSLDAERPFAELVRSGISPEEVSRAWDRRQADAALTATGDKYMPSLARWLADPGVSGCRQMVLADREAAARRDGDGAGAAEPEYGFAPAAGSCGERIMFVLRDGRPLRPLVDGRARPVPATARPGDCLEWLEGMRKRGEL